MGPRSAISMLAFTVIVMIIVILIALVNWLPSMFREHTLRRYDTIEAMKSDLRIKRLFIPSYFPQSIAWPPSDIAGQSRPFVGTIMLFRSGAGKQRILAITQATEDRFPPEELIPLTRITERAEHALPGRTALLEVGVCGNDTICSRLSWKDGEYSVTLTMHAPPFELLKIASSMTH